MIIVGDIASPDKKNTDQLEAVLREYEAIFSKKKIVFNLEGLLSDQNGNFKQPILWSHTTLPSVLKATIDPVFCLANNHSLDLPDEYNNTIRILKEEGVAFTGVGKSKEEALKPVCFYDGKQHIILFNACWDFLLYNQKNPKSGIYVGELDELNLLEEVLEYKSRNQNSKIVVFLHWSLDLETLPFPMYRSFSRDLIDSGASLVTGCHSHCIQGGEKYKNGYIVYGLGNFYIPQRYFMNSKLEYPDFASIEMAFEWNPSINQAICHWFKSLNKDTVQRLDHICSDEFEFSSRLLNCSPYQGMSDKEYISFFRKHRRKKILVPLYRTYKMRNLNRYLTKFLKLRAHFARLLAELGIRKWLN